MSFNTEHLSNPLVPSDLPQQVPAEEVINFGADVMDSGVQLSRRGFLRLAGFTAAAVPAIPAVLPTFDKLQVEDMGQVIEPGTSLSLGKRTDNQLSARLAENMGNFYVETPDPIFANCVSIIDLKGDFHAQGFIVEQDGDLYNVVIGHVIEDTLLRDGGQYYAYTPKKGFYAVRPETWYLTKPFDNDLNDVTYAYHKLTNNSKDRFGVHQNYYRQTGGLSPLHLVWRNPEDNENSAVFRPDQAALEMTSFKGWGKDYQFYGGYQDEGANVMVFESKYGRYVVCGGMSGSPMFELFSDSLQPTGGVFGGLSTGGFKQHPGYNSDYYGKIGDDRGCEVATAIRLLPLGRLIPYSTVPSSQLSGLDSRISSPNLKNLIDLYKQ